MQEGWTLLDVRPASEHKKASVDGAVSVPVYVDENDFSVSSLIKQSTALGMGGWWLGGGHMKPNPQFLQQVQEQVPKNGSRVIVACQKGLRSVCLCLQLVSAADAHAVRPELMLEQGSLHKHTRSAVHFEQQCAPQMSHCKWGLTF